MRKTIVLMCGLILIASMALGDTVVLKDGTKYTGKIVRKTLHSIWIKTEEGKVLKIKKSSIAKMSRGKPKRAGKEETPSAKRSRLASGKKYKTTQLGYIDIYGNSASLPVQFESHALRLAFIYKKFGIGMSGFKLYTNDFGTLFGEEDGDNGNDSMMVISQEEDGVGGSIATIAPIYFYFIPFSSSRKAGNVIPMVGYSYLGGSLWGLNGARFFDLGLGITLFLLDFRLGWNTLSSDSRDPFRSSDIDESFSQSSVYASVGLSTGFWFSLGTE